MSNTIRKRTASISLLDLGTFIKSLYLLMKPRVMSLVIFTCAVGFLTSDSNTMGKSLDSDIFQGKQTIMVIIAKNRYK